MRKISKKGAEMTIGTIIIIVLALVVLVVLIVGFTGGWSNLWENVKAFFGGGSNVGTIVTACQTACTSNLQYDYCKERDVKFDDKSLNGKYNCAALAKIGNLGLSCDKNFDNCPEITRKSCAGFGGTWTSLDASGKCKSGRDPVAETDLLDKGKAGEVCCN